MVIVDRVMHGHRSIMGVLRAVALLALCVWGVVNLVDGDWFIGGVMFVCVLLLVPSRVSAVRRMRREERAAR